MENSVFISPKQDSRQSGTNSLTRKYGKLGWPGQKIRAKNLESAARRSWRPLLLRYNSPSFEVINLVIIQLS